jgi:VanZ family protein
MHIMDKTKTDPIAKWRWAAWLAFTLLWSIALLVPDPFGFFNRHVLGGAELAHETTFLMAKSLHVAAYATAAVLTGWLHAPVPWRWLLLLFWFIHADATELGQLLVPGRSGELRDVALDHFGLLIGLGVSWRWWQSTPAHDEEETPRD